MEIYEPKSEEDFEKYYDLRWRILRRPWDQPRGSEKDGLEDKSLHVMVCEKDRMPVGEGNIDFKKILKPFKNKKYVTLLIDTYTNELIERSVANLKRILGTF